MCLSIKTALLRFSYFSVEFLSTIVFLNLCVQVAGNRERVSHVLRDTGRQTGEEDLWLLHLPDRRWTGSVKITTTTL